MLLLASDPPPMVGEKFREIEICEAHTNLLREADHEKPLAMFRVCFIAASISRSRAHPSVGLPAAIAIGCVAFTGECDVRIRFESFD